jgi:FixJ family two-component response regulator
LVVAHIVGRLEVELLDDPLKKQLGCDWAAVSNISISQVGQRRAVIVAIAFVSHKFAEVFTVIWYASSYFIYLIGNLFLLTWRHDPRKLLGGFRCLLLTTALHVRDGQSLPIVFVSGHGDIPMSVQAIKAGATDFLTKPVRAEALLAATRSAIEQHASARQALADTAELRHRFASLTPRERDVLAALAKGKLNKQIAADLGIVEQTVKFHRARIMDRMQAKTSAELMHIAGRLGIDAATPASSTAPSVKSAKSPQA